MRRWAIFLSFVVFAVVAVGCAPKQSGALSSEDARTVSIALLTEAMDIDETKAEAVIDLLAQEGMEGEVLFAYPATDDADRPYFHVWIGENTVDVYISDVGDAVAFSRAGVVIYGELPMPDEDESDTGEGEEAEPIPSTITLDSHTATVAPGETGRVSMLGTPGEQYKIKVYYASGVSSAKALSPKVADENGRLVWEWTVSRQVKPGVYKIEVVHAENKEDKIVLPFEVVETTEE